MPFSIVAVLIYIHTNTDGQQAHEKVLKFTNYQGNAKPQGDVTSHVLEWLLPKRQEITSVGEDVEEKERSHT